MRGSCLCGKIEFETVGELASIYQCHCSLCCKQSGSSSNSATVIDGSRFRWLSRLEYVSSYAKPTAFRSDFCSNCGSPVPNKLRNTPYYWVPAGLLDGDVRLEIVAHLFVGSKASWDMIPLNGPHYETTPELADLVAMLVPKN